MRAARAARAMRVLLAVHAFPPASTAGVEVYTLRLAQDLRDLGHEVRILTAVHDLAAEPYSLRLRGHEGIDVAEVVNVHHLGTLEATYDDPGVDRASAQIFAEFQPDVVHLQHLLNLSTGIIREARAVGARVVLTLHDYWLSCPRDGLRMRADLALCSTMDHSICARCLGDSPYLVPPLQRGLSGAARRAGLGRALHRLHALAPRVTEAALRLLRRLSPVRTEDLASAMDRRAAHLRKAIEDVDLFLAPTAFARERTLEFGVPPEKVRVLSLGAVHGPTRPRPAGGRRRFGYVGTLAPHKGIHVLIEAFRGVSDPQATLDLHGSLMVHPSYVESLRQAAAGDPRIRFHGPFPEGEQERVLGSLDVLVLPSLWWENSPLTVLEALAAGIPVVASRVGGLPEIVSHGASGLLVPAGDPRALREALQEVVEDRGLAGGLRALPLKTVGEGARELVGIYESLRRGAGPGPPTL